MRRSYLAEYILTSLVIIMILPLHLSAQTFSPSVKSYIKVNADTIAITDVELIDGSGGAIKQLMNA